MTAQHFAQLDAALESALATAQRSGAAQWLALQTEVAVTDALAAFEAAEAGDRFYWERPAEGRALAAFGCARSIESEGKARFGCASARAKRLFERVHVAGAGAPEIAGPFLVGGFAFEDAAPRAAHWRAFPAARLVLPQTTLAVAAGRGWLTLVRAVEPGADRESLRDALRAQHAEALGALASRDLLGASTPSLAEAGGPPRYVARADRTHAEYRDQVEAALREIADGGFEKVVLARSISLREEGDYDPHALLETLRVAQPSCAIFAVARGDAVFLGATPECLMRVVDGRVETASVAGSAPRGRSPEEDRELGRELRESKKEQAEHAFVVRALCDALAAHCDGLEVRESPRLMRLQDIQHLETPIAGRLRERTSILELLGAVHPTPAISGAPRDAALEWLNRNEQLDRGWYSGPVGYVDAAGGGEFFAALRSALLCGNEARLFAGAGIVAESDPEAELRETRLKLRAMLGPLMEI